MVTQLKRLLQPPAYDDEETTRVARLLHVLLLALAGVIFGFGTVLVLITGRFSPSTLVTLAMGGVYLAMWIALRRGHVRAVSIAMPLAFLVSTILVVYYFGTARSSASTFFIVCMILGGLLLGNRGTAVYAVLSSLAMAGLLVAERQGLLPPEETAYPYFAYWLTYAGVLTFIGVMLGLSANSLRHAMQRLRANERRLIESNLELHSIRASLEQQVSERTGAAEAARASAEATHAALQDRAWLAAGQAALNDRMRGEQDLTTLAGNVIGQLCRYLDAPTGALFLLESDVLRLAGSYAYTPRPDTPAEFRVGEGLIGQAVLEKRTLHLTGVPAGYITVSSGLGDADAEDLLIVPLLYEGQVTGAVEIGALRALTPRQVEFVASVMENTAIAFNTARARMRMDALLRQMQRQA
jgi:hypothetical protein